MKAEEKIVKLLKPQRLAGNKMDGFTADALAGQAGITVNTARKILNKLKEEGRAAHFQDSDFVTHGRYWFSSLWTAPAEAATPVTLPPPSFDTPATGPQAEPQQAEKPPVAWVRCFIPKSKHRHLRSPHNRFVTRCGMRITANWQNCGPIDMKQAVGCAACQRAAQTQKTHQHEWAPSGLYAEYCRVKGCKAMREKKAE